MWVCDADPMPTFYVIKEDHRGSFGQMYRGIEIHTGQPDTFFMSYDRFNGWEKLA